MTPQGHGRSQSTEEYLEALFKLARTATDYGLATVATAFGLDGGAITAPRVAVGVATNRPVRLTEVEELLTGEAPSEALFANAELIARGVVKPRGDFRASPEYRKQLVGVLVKRALATTLERL